MSSDADIAIYGGAAGGGKTWALLLEPLYHFKVPHFGAVLFRRTFPEIDKKGGMWDESAKIYPLLGAAPHAGKLEWTFPLPGGHGSTVQFAHCQHNADAEHWKGAQIPLLGIDQLESFTEYQFWYLLSRNRSMCAVPSYCRATCNPVPSDDPTGGWLHRLIQWWIDPDTGLAIEARAGAVRWFVRLNEVLEWGDTAADLVARFPETICHLTVKACAAIAVDQIACQKEHAKSLTFIPSRLEDNPALMRADPGYISTLKALPLVERERLYGGNWNARPTAGRIFNRAWFKLVAALPATLRYVRYWDKAGTDESENPAAAYTAGVKIGRDDVTGYFYVTHVVRGQWSAHQRETVIKNTALTDGLGVDQWVEQEPGSGGKESAQNTIINLAGVNVHADRVTGDKLTRAGPYSAQVEAGNVYVLLDEWTESYITELHNFDPEAGGYKDQVDASSGAFNKLALTGGPMVFRSGMTAIAPDGKTAVEQAVQKQGYYWPGGR